MGALAFALALAAYKGALTIQAGGGAPTYLCSAPPAPSKEGSPQRPGPFELPAQRAPRCALGASDPRPLMG